MPHTAATMNADQLIGSVLSSFHVACARLLSNAAICQCTSARQSRALNAEIKNSYRAAHFFFSLCCLVRRRMCGSRRCAAAVVCICVAHAPILCARSETVVRYKIRPGQLIYCIRISRGHEQIRMCVVQLQLLMHCDFWRVAVHGCRHYLHVYRKCAHKLLKSR